MITARTNKQMILRARMHVMGRTASVASVGAEIQSLLQTKLRRKAEEQAMPVLTSSEQTKEQFEMKLDEIARYSV